MSTTYNPDPTTGTSPDHRASSSLKPETAAISQRSRVMKTFLLGAAAAAAAPALLLLGAGTAAAKPVIDPSPDIGLGGVTIHVKDVGGQSAWCEYISWRVGGGGDYRSLPFFLGKDASADVVIWPALPAGHTWETYVDCHYLPDGQSDRVQIPF